MAAWWQLVAQGNAVQIHTVAGDGQPRILGRPRRTRVIAGLQPGWQASGFSL